VQIVREAAAKKASARLWQSRANLLHVLLLVYRNDLPTAHQLLTVQKLMLPEAAAALPRAARTKGRSPLPV